MSIFKIYANLFFKYREIFKFIVYNILKIKSE